MQSHILFSTMPKVLLPETYKDDALFDFLESMTAIQKYIASNLKGAEQ